eukprot:6406217-Alexandrium_andersonii.AAC.1
MLRRPASCSWIPNCNLGAPSRLHPFPFRHVGASILRRPASCSWALQPQNGALLAVMPFSHVHRPRGGISSVHGLPLPRIAQYRPPRSLLNLP